MNEKDELLEEETDEEVEEETAETTETAETADTDASGDADAQCDPEDAGDVPDETDGSDELEAEKERYLRLYAEFDNYRKRTAKEKLETYGEATARTVEQLLPVVDNFERAVEAPCSDEQYHSGMEMILRQLKTFLEKLEVKEIEALGAAFDPNIHQAIKQAEATEEYPDGTVCEVFQKGYMLRDRLIRPAMVAVAS